MKALCSLCSNRSSSHASKWLTNEQKNYNLDPHFIASQGQRSVRYKTEVKISHKGLTNYHAGIIADKYLRYNTNIETLILSHNNIGYKGIFRILESIVMNPESRLTELQINDQNPNTMYLDGKDIKSALFDISYSPDNELTIKVKKHVYIPRAFNLKLNGLYLQNNHMMSDEYNKILSEYLKFFQKLIWVNLERSVLTNGFVEDIISITMHTEKCITTVRMHDMSSNLHPERVYEIWMNSLYKFLVSNPNAKDWKSRSLIYQTSTDEHYMSFSTFGPDTDYIKYTISPIQGHDKDEKMSTTKAEFMKEMLYNKVRHMKWLSKRKLRYSTSIIKSMNRNGIIESMNRNDKYKL
jgi:hypothetical protein